MLAFETAILVTYLIFQFIWINTVGYLFNASVSHEHYDFFVVLGKWWASKDYVTLIWLSITILGMVIVFFKFLIDPMRFSAERP